MPNDTVQMIRGLVATGVLRPIPPRRLLRLVTEARRWGPTAAAAAVTSAVRHPREPAVVDEAGTLDWEALDRRTNAITHGLRALGIGEDDVVGVLCRNHRGFVEASVVAGKLGADAVLLNTGFSGPQLGDVARREGVTVLFHDQDFAQEVAGSGLDGRTTRFVAWQQPDPAVAAPAGGAGATTFDELARSGRTDLPPAPHRHSNVVILSSGTTGTPKGTRRTIDRSSTRDGAKGSPLGILARIPLRSRARTLISAPLFHSWGLSHMMVAGLLSSPMVLRVRFDAEDVLATIERERVDTLIAVPAMLQRILDLPADVRSGYDTSSLRVVALSGSALPGGLATRWMDAFGDTLYSLYGSTEVAGVAVAGPADLRAAPDTAGPVLPGIDVRILKEDGTEAAVGEAGGIYVRSSMVFDGYTGGGSKQVVDGYMSTGDVGHLDRAGRLFVGGREDDMIVSGGENVFPQEVEEVILRLPGVKEAIVVGVPDEQFGQRLAALVVPEQADGLTPDEVRQWVRDNLARHKVPRTVELSDELPRNPTGKVLRRVVAERLGGASDGTPG